MLRQIVVLHKPVLTRDALGGMQTTFTPAGKVWACLLPQIASSEERAAHLEGVVFYRVQMRWHQDLKSGWRLTTDSHLLRVLSVWPLDQTHRFLACDAEEIGQ